MNWTRAILAGVVAGIAKNLADWVMHGFIMANTYGRFEVFDREPAHPLHFFLVAVCIGVMAGLLFARTRESWGEGLKGGATFGFWVGLVTFFGNFYSTLVIAGFPYYLSWCWGGIELIGMVVMGAVLGLVYKRT